MKSMQWRVIGQVSAILMLLLVLAAPGRAADEASATEQGSKAVSQSAQAVTAGITTLQERVSDNRLVNRTSDDIVAFVLMGVLVASISGIFSKIGYSGLGMAGRIGLGLVGAYMGSMVVRVAKIDLGWSEVIMSYEELLFSLLGAVVIVALSRFIQWKMKKSKS
jgi:uncharacterized membrane protein YeaQ/YmgE (transglycosylase-associated protein family)